MKVGDLVNNIHALDRSGLGLIVKVRPTTDDEYRPCNFQVRWINPPTGCPEYSWNNAAWLEKIE